MTLGFRPAATATAAATIAATVAAIGTVAAAAGLARRASHVCAVAPELRTPMTWVPLAVTNKVALAVGRRMFTRGTEPVPGVDVDRWAVPRLDGDPDGDPDGGEVSTYVYRPDTSPDVAQRDGSRAVLVWIHGGGTILGVPEGDHELCSLLARDADLVVVNVEYRLAPEHPFPAGLEDCYTVLREVHAHADSLGVDRDRIAVGGASAGGGLAAALAQMAHDHGEVPVAFQLLVYPMLDDRTVLRTDHAGRDHLAWTPASNAYAWTKYLGHPPRLSDTAPYAAAARRDDLAGLPPAWIGIGDLDLFYEEDITYADRLRAAGVPCELHIEPRMPHAADVATPNAPSMRAFRQRMVEALHTGLRTAPPALGSASSPGP